MFGKVNSFPLSLVKIFIMAIIDKSEFAFPTDGIVTFDNVEYIADKLILFPITNDEINLDNCTCLFSILERPIRRDSRRQYVGAKFFKNLNNSNAQESINGYDPEHIFCFTKTEFPLRKFINKQDFKNFNEL